MSDFYPKRRFDGITLIGIVCTGGTLLLIVGYATYAIGNLLGAW